MNTLAIIIALWGVGCAAVIAACWRFGIWLDKASDPDSRVTRWNRHGGFHGEDTAKARRHNHGLNLP